MVFCERWWWGWKVKNELPGLVGACPERDSEENNLTTRSITPTLLVTWKSYVEIHLIMRVWKAPKMFQLKAWFLEAPFGLLSYIVFKARCHNLFTTVNMKILLQVRTLSSLLCLYIRMLTGKPRWRCIQFVRYARIVGNPSIIGGQQLGDLRTGWIWPADGNNGWCNSSGVWLIVTSFREFRLPKLNYKGPSSEQ